MRHPSTTLALLAGSACALGAADITDKDLVVSLGGVFQLRAEAADAQNAAGADYDVNTGQTGQGDDVDFYIRRLRLTTKVTWQEVWRLNFTLNADRAEQPRGDGTNASTATTAATRNVGIYQAFLARDFKVGSLLHSVQGGLDTTFFNRAGDIGPNTQTLFLNQRATAALLNVRGVGVGYRLASPMVRAGIDIQNNIGDDRTLSTEVSDGLCYTGRIEITGPGDWAIGKWQEDFVGKAGRGWCLGLDLGYNDGDKLDSLNEATYDQDINGGGIGTITPGAGESILQNTLAYGVDLLVHWDDLNALAEVRMARTDAEIDTAGGPFDADYSSLVWLVQAGYCFHLPNDTVLEPALRYTMIDLNTDNDQETASFGSADFGTSGVQYEAGLNWFISGHGNKLCLALTLWEAEEAEADATIVRMQYQVLF